MEIEHLSEMIMFSVFFYAVYMAMRLLTDFFLKKSIIKTGHYERADILSQGLIITPESETSPETNKYPSLKWGLVAFMAGVGFVLINILGLDIPVNNEYNPILPIGIELMCISAGFLLYFFIANYTSKTK